MPEQRGAIQLPPETDPRPRRRWFRFGLRSLLLLVLLVTSAGGLWWRRKPWVIAREANALRLDVGVRHPHSIKLSGDGTRLAVSYWPRNVYVCDSLGDPEPLLIRTDSPITLVEFSKDNRILKGKSPGLAFSWDTVDGRLLSKNEGEKEFHAMNVSFTNDGNRFVSAGSSVQVHVADKPWEPTAYPSPGLVLHPYGDSHYCAAISPTGLDVVTADDQGRLCLFQRRRPEQWWGIAWLWEFWATVVFSIALILSLLRDRRRFREEKVRMGGEVGA